jgi:hypothetical protein
VLCRPSVCAGGNETIWQGFRAGNNAVEEGLMAGSRVYPGQNHPLECLRYYSIICSFILKRSSWLVHASTSGEQSLVCLRFFIYYLSFILFYNRNHCLECLRFFVRDVGVKCGKWDDAPLFTKPDAAGKGSLGQAALGTAPLARGQSYSTPEIPSSTSTDMADIRNTAETQTAPRV